MTDRLDPAVVERLATVLARHVRDHLGGDPDRAKIFEVLNAVAFAVAPVIAGCGPDERSVMSWFTLAVDEAVADIKSIRRAP